MKIFKKSVFSFKKEYYEQFLNYKENKLKEMETEDCADDEPNVDEYIDRFIGYGDDANDLEDKDFEFFTAVFPEDAVLCDYYGNRIRIEDALIEREDTL